MDNTASTMSSLDYPADECDAPLRLLSPTTTSSTSTKPPDSDRDDSIPLIRSRSLRSKEQANVSLLSSCHYQDPANSILFDGSNSDKESATSSVSPRTIATTLYSSQSYDTEPSQGTSTCLSSSTAKDRTVAGRQSSQNSGRFDSNSSVSSLGTKSADASGHCRIPHSERSIPKRFNRYDWTSQPEEKVTAVKERSLHANDKSKTPQATAPSKSTTIKGTNAPRKRAPPSRPRPSLMELDTLVRVIGKSDPRSVKEFRHSSILLQYASKDVLPHHIQPWVRPESPSHILSTVVGPSHNTNEEDSAKASDSTGGTILYPTVDTHRVPDATTRSTSDGHRRPRSNVLDTLPPPRFYLPVHAATPGDWSYLQPFLEPHAVQTAVVSAENLPHLLPWFTTLKLHVLLQACDTHLYQHVSALPTTPTAAIYAAQIDLSNTLLLAQIAIVANLQVTATAALVSAASWLEQHPAVWVAQSTSCNQTTTTSMLGTACKLLLQCLISEPTQLTRPAETSNPSPTAQQLVARTKASDKTPPKWLTMFQPTSAARLLSVAVSYLPSDCAMVFPLDTVHDVQRFLTNPLLPFLARCGIVERLSRTVPTDNDALVPFTQDCPGSSLPTLERNGSVQPTRTDIMNGGVETTVTASPIRPRALQFTATTPDDCDGPQRNQSPPHIQALESIMHLSMEEENSVVASSDESIEAQERRESLYNMSDELHAGWNSMWMRLAVGNGELKSQASILAAAREIKHHPVAPTSTPAALCTDPSQRDERETTPVNMRDSASRSLQQHQPSTRHSIAPKSARSDVKNGIMGREPPSVITTSPTKQTLWLELVWSKLSDPPVFGGDHTDSTVSTASSPSSLAATRSAARQSGDMRDATALVVSSALQEDFSLLISASATTLSQEAAPRAEDSTTEDLPKSRRRTFAC